MRKKFTENSCILNENIILWLLESTCDWRISGVIPQGARYKKADRLGAVFLGVQAFFCAYYQEEER